VITGIIAGGSAFMSMALVWHNSRYISKSGAMPAEPRLWPAICFPPNILLLNP
jgi:hypothetical protein